METLADDLVIQVGAEVKVILANDLVIEMK